MSMKINSRMKSTALPSSSTWRVWRFATEKACAYWITLDGEPYLYEAVLPGDAVLLLTKDGRFASGVRRIYLKRQDGGHVVLYFDRCIDFKQPYSVPENPNESGTDSDTLRSLERSFLEELLRKEGLLSFERLPMLDADDGENQRYVRDLLQLAVKDDLLGPADGDVEEIVGMSVRDRYLVGRLAPRVVDQTGGSASEEDGDAATLQLKANPDHASRDNSTVPSPAAEDEEAEADESDNRSLTPSSLGLTFCIDKDQKEVELSVSWGRYARVESETVVNEKTGKPALCWKRIPSGGTVTVPVREGAIRTLVVDENSSDVQVQGEVTPPFENGCRLMTIFLVNMQEEPKTNRDTAWVFQPEMRVSAKGGRAVFVRRPFRDSTLSDAELASLDLIYRRSVEFAVGHGVSVHVTPSLDDHERAVEIKTVVMPEYEVPVTETPGGDELDRPVMQRLLKEGLLDMRQLAKMDCAQLTSTLKLLVDDYGAWIDENEARAKQVKMEGQLREAADRAICDGRQILSRLREGIEVLGSDDSALEAFRFTNRVMAEQRVHSLYALSRRRGENKNLKTFDKPKNHTWRPFQLAFILLSIPSLSDPRHKDRTNSLTAIADLLWFPTGGGKTEAYLGVAAFTMAIRRLKPTLGGLDGSRGLAVIMRYTLRLLTIQQFQRAAALMCAMEVERQQAPGIWGETPFTLGLWVGNKVTPGTTEDSHAAIVKEREGHFGAGATPAQLTTCPWCGSEIQAGREIKVNRDTSRTRIFCGDARGACPFSNQSDESGGLPVVVVDEEIYHRPPSMLIATVDKFAMMAWKGAVRTLFGQAESECPRHGLVLPDDTDCRGRHNRKGGLEATQPKPIVRLRPPDLIIQDEFHLISGPLGTMVGLYETAIDELCSWDLEGVKVRPKIIASTATVRKAAEQVNNVFLRKVSIFPQHGLDVADNFFSVQRPIESRPGRRYLGICAPGSSRPSTMIRVYVALLTGAQSLFDSFGALADPYMTLVGYFNSLRELGGMRRLSEDDVQTRSYRVLLETKIRRPGLAQRKVRVVDELTSRVSNRDIPKKLDQLEVKYKSEWLKGETRAIDVVLATNMLSVGVDVNRLGLMVVNGQPKNTAEYIQATSRVGRAFPGLVCTVLSWARPRDFSHYETFEYYHRTFYKHVEAQSVTPFAARAMDRGLTGVMASLLRHSDAVFNPNLGAGELTKTTHPSVVAAHAATTSRAWKVTENSEVRDRSDLMGKDRLDLWIKEAHVPGRRLGYEKPSGGGDVYNLLKRAGVAQWDKFTVPMSMREVESEVRLIMDKRRRDLTDPEWKRFEPEENDKGGKGNG